MASARSLWTWTPVAQDDRFARAYHTCTPIHGRIYLYGGVKSGNPKDPPLADVVTFDPEQKMTEAKSPQGTFRRSHHAAALLGESCMCIVGGWDGKWRLASVLAYDVETDEWVQWTTEPTSGGPLGLNGHTCTKISNHELCVVGREGGLHTQRRYSSLYTLWVNPSTRTYRYKEEETRTASRSGHVSVLLPSGPKQDTRATYSLYVFGGREADTGNWVRRWSRDKVQEDTASSPRLTEQLSRLVSVGNAKCAAPKGLRYQSCSAVGPFLVVFGGEAPWKSRNAVSNDLYICDTRCSPLCWYHFSGSDPSHKRVGHRTCLVNDRLYMVGGFGADGTTLVPEISVLDIL